MADLLTFHFWFNPSPVSMMPAFTYGFFVFFALLAIGAALLRIISKRALRDALEKQAFRMAGNMAAWLSAFGFIWLFCTYEEVQIFGVRAWFILWGIIMIACLVRLYVFVKKEAPGMRMKSVSQASVNAYLPRRSR